MRVLLPPSESKRPGGGSDVYRPESLAFAEQLSETRAAVQSALVNLSADEDDAAKALKVGVKARTEISYNLDLQRSGTLPAIERYIGVLYDAIFLDSLQPAQREWINDHVMIQSALLGLIRASDEIPAYRLSANSQLREMGTPMKRVWNSAHKDIDWARTDWVLDLRSQDYAALAPIPDAVPLIRLGVAQRSHDGEVRALNHFNKAAKGDLVRRLAVSQASLQTPKQFEMWAESEGLEMQRSDKENEMTLVTQFGTPAST